MSDQLSALRLFVRVAATGSFSRAARELTLSQPTASRIIAQLEEELGGTLFVRSTRAVTLTEAGSDYLAQIKPILETLDEANQAVRGDGELHGTLRIGASSITASRILVPRLQTFADRHPALRIELMIEDRRQDLIAENVDLVVRFGKLTDSSALARWIGQWPLIAAAAPSYIERHGLPGSPSDLADHLFVIAGPAARKGMTFRKNGEEIAIQIKGRLAISGAEVAINAGVAGLGIIVASYPGIERELERNELTRLLPDWDIGTIEVHALFPSEQTPKPAARLFAEFLIESLPSR